MSLIKFETHCHSLGGSVCAKSSNEQIIEDYVKNGYGGIVLTNHYASYTFECDYKKKTLTDNVDYFFELYDSLKKHGEQNGVKIFYGIEVRIVATNTEYMLYGFKPEFLYNNPFIYNLTQQELFELCNKNGIFMYQTHPFRQGVKAGLPQFMHGAEAFNGHFHHPNNNAEASEFCKQNNLIEMCGTDYHVFNQPLTSAMYFPDTVRDIFDLTEYLFTQKPERVEMEEYYQQEYKKFRGL